MNVLLCSATGVYGTFKIYLTIIQIKPGSYSWVTTFKHFTS